MDESGGQTTPAQLARIFGRLSLTSFGGPAAHIALMRDEMVDRRKWLDAASLGLMAGVTWQLADDGIRDPLSVLLAAATALALWRTELNPALLIVAGGLTGVVAGLWPT